MWISRASIVDILDNHHKAIEGALKRSEDLLDLVHDFAIGAKDAIKDLRNTRDAHDKRIRNLEKYMYELRDKEE